MLFQHGLVQATHFLIAQLTSRLTPKYLSESIWDIRETLRNVSLRNGGNSAITESSFRFDQPCLVRQFHLSLLSWKYGQSTLFLNASAMRNRLCIKRISSHIWSAPSNFFIWSELCKAASAQRPLSSSLLHPRWWCTKCDICRHWKSRKAPLMSPWLLECPVFTVLWYWEKKTGSDEKLVYPQRTLDIPPPL